MQAAPLACYAAIVLPILLVPQLGPWARQIRHLPPIKGGRCTPPARLQKRWKHRRNPLPSPLPCHIAGAVTVSVEARFSIGDGAITALSQAGNLELEFCRQQEIVAVKVLNEFASRCETPRLARRARAAVLTVDRANFRMTLLPTPPLRVLFRRLTHRRR